MPNRHMIDATRTLLAKARTAGMYGSDIDKLEKHLETVSTAYDAAQARAAKIKTDRNLTPEGKRAAINAELRAAREQADAAIADARGALDWSRRYTERRATLPRSQDDRRNERMMAARHDVDRLLATAAPGEVADRLRHAVESSPDIAELVLADGYDRRVALPALGKAYETDARMWDVTREKLITERLTDDGRAALGTLKALRTAEGAVTALEHAARSADGDLAAETINAYGREGASDA